MLRCSKRNRQFWALVEIWTSMCPRRISVRCTGSTAKLRIPSMGYPEILYLAIKLFIELITSTWWQKIIEKGPSCPAMTKKHSWVSIVLVVVVLSPGYMPSGFSGSPQGLTWNMVFPPASEVHVYLCFNNYCWKISRRRLNCYSIAFLRESNRQGKKTWERVQDWRTLRRSPRAVLLLEQHTPVAEDASPC